MNNRVNLNDPDAWSEFDWSDPAVPEALKRTDKAVNTARANRLRAQDPEFEKQRKEKFYKKMRDPAHLKKLTEVNQGVALKLLQPIITPEGMFPSKKDAAAHYQKILGKESPNAGNNYISYKLKIDKENYQLITSEEYARLKKINLNDPNAWSKLDWDEPSQPAVLKKSDATVNRSRSAFFKKDDPIFSKTMSKVATERNQDTTYIEKLHNGVANRDNTYQAECNARPEVKEKISKSLKENYTKTEEHLAKVAAKNKERSKPIMTPWGEFVSRKAAVVWAQENTDIGNVDKKIQKWVKTPGSGYYYI